MPASVYYHRMTCGRSVPSSGTTAPWEAGGRQASHFHRSQLLARKAGGPFWVQIQGAGQRPWPVIMRPNYFGPPANKWKCMLMPRTCVCLISSAYMMFQRAPLPRKGPLPAPSAQTHQSSVTAKDGLTRETVAFLYSSHYHCGTMAEGTTNENPSIGKNIGEPKSNVFSDVCWNLETCHPGQRLPKIQPPRLGSNAIWKLILRSKKDPGCLLD